MCRYGAEESHLAGASSAEQKQVMTQDLMAWEIPDSELTERCEVGAGAFGIVMKTRWRGTVVAMKQLHRHLHHDEVAKAEFRTELKLMRQLHHPHIVQFLGTSVDVETGLVSLCFEFMHAGSLDMLFRKQVPVSLGHATEMALDVARGMSYLHGRKPLPVIHRDLKPGNLMLTRAQRLKIGDFGLSKTLSVRNKMPQDLDQNFTMTGETGSYRYMAGLWGGEGVTTSRLLITRFVCIISPDDLTLIFSFTKRACARALRNSRV